MLADGKTNAVKAVGFKRRVLYAPLKQRDLRIGNYLYLQLESPSANDQTVEVQNPEANSGRRLRFIAKADPLRWSPVIHVNQVGYLPAVLRLRWSAITWAVWGNGFGNAFNLETNQSRTD